MGLSDPFSTTYEGARQGLGTLGESILGVAGLYAKKKEEERKKQTSMDMLKQFGIITEKPATTAETVKAYEDVANKNIKNTYGELKTQGNIATDDQKLELLNTLFDKFGLQKPTVKSKGLTLNYDAAVKAGVSFNPATGETIFAPKRPEKTLSEQLQEAEIAKEKGLGYRGGKIQTPTGGMADTSGLTSEQLTQGMALGRKISGVRGAEKIAPYIFDEMRKGKTIDEIDDSLRFAGQSPEFSGIRPAAQQIMAGKSKNEKDSVFDDLDDLSEDLEGQKNYIKRLMIKQAGVEEGRGIVSKERTIKLLGEIQDDLNNLEKAGIDTNIFSGTEEQVANKIGLVVNPGAKKVATKIQTAVQNYRRGMTGVAFGQIENKEYKNMFPSISKTGKLNTAIIDGLRESFSGDLDNFYSLSMGEDNYKKLFGGRVTQKGEPQARTQNIPEGQTATNPTTGEKMIYRGGKWQKI